MFGGFDADHDLNILKGHRTQQRFGGLFVK